MRSLCRRFIHKFTYLSRTSPNVEPLLQPLEDIIRTQLIPAWTGGAPPNDSELKFSELYTSSSQWPGTINPANRIVSLYYMHHLSAPLSHFIECQQQEPSVEAHVEAKRGIPECSFVEGRPMLLQRQRGQPTSRTLS